MADKGIIFSGAMVKALLDGRKTQTRRLLADAPTGDWYCDRGAVGLRWVAAPGAPSMPCRVPYAPGDRLYVREAYTVRGVYSDVVEVGYRAHERASHSEFVEQWPIETAVDAKGKRPVVTWPFYKPSIYMPRWASRLWLSVTDVRVQRVVEIKWADAVAEGMTSPLTPLSDFADLWNSLHTKPGERWEDNPFVVVVSFSVHHGNIDR